MKRLYVIGPRRLIRTNKLCLWKLGISDDPNRRAGEIEQSMLEKGVALPLRCFFSVPLITARLVEKKGHGLLARWRSKRVPEKSSGYTEWFDHPNCLVALIWLFAIAPLFPAMPEQVRGLIGLILLIAPIPFDFIVGVALVALAEWFVFLGLVSLITKYAFDFSLFAYIIKAAKAIAAIINYLI